MTDPFLASASVERPNTHGARRRRGVDLVIEGEAVVLTRRSDGCAVRQADGRVASCEPEARDAGPFVMREPEPLRYRRDMPRIAKPARRPAASDLIFQGPAFAGRFAGKAAAARRTGLAKFLGISPAGKSGRILAGAVLIMAIVLPAALLGMPGKLPAGPGASGTSADFAISEIDARILARGGGDVLSVDALVRNVSAKAAFVPPVRLAFAADDGASWTKPFGAADRTLAAGAALRFHSAVAVPPGVRGDVSVDLMRLPRRR